MLYLVDKDFEAVIVHMFKELKKKASSQYARAQGSFVKQRKVLGSRVK